MATIDCGKQAELFGSPSGVIDVDDDLTQDTDEGAAQTVVFRVGPEVECLSQSEESVPPFIFHLTSILQILEQPDAQNVEWKLAFTVTLIIFMMWSPGPYRCIWRVFFRFLVSLVLRM